MWLTSEEIAFRWWCSLAREKSDLDSFGFPRDTSRVSSEGSAFGDTWLDSCSSNETRSTQKSPHWFFDANETEEQSHENSAHKKPVWDEKDDEMLDRLLGDEDGIPNLQWSYSFEEPSWKFEKKQDEFHVNGSKEEEIFCNQEFRWDEAKFFDMDETFTAVSTETGSDLSESLSEYCEDDISTLTASGIYSIESTGTASSEETNWYRAKIASLFASKKRPVIKMRQEDLEVWPKNKIPLPPTAETPLLVQVSQEELTRRISIMHERQMKKVEIENLAKSEDPKLREIAQDQLKKLWITAYMKKPRNSGLSSSKKENLIGVLVEQV